MQTAWLISIGTELTLGQTVDTNSAWLAARLAALGVRAARHVTVPDDLAATRDAVLEAGAAADLVVLTGGLGPTADDLTRQALAEALGVPLESDAASLVHLREFFASRGRPMPESNRVQALLPRGARALPNTCGTAPGIRITLRGRPCYALPGVPFEMRAMFDREVAPEVQAASAGRVLLARRLNTFGLGESLLGEQIADLMQRGRNPEVGTTADLGIIGIRVNARADSPAAATALLDETEAELRRRLGPLIYGRDNEPLAGAVGTLLRARGQMLATAESCTGGLLGALLTDIPGSSEYYAGGLVTYANRAKADLLAVPPALLERHGAVSAPVAQAMAAGAARALHAGCALAITGIAGPAGGTPAKPVGLVHVAVLTPDGTDVHELRLGSDAPRDVIRLRAAHTALNLLRLKLLGPPPSP